MHFLYANSPPNKFVFLIVFCEPGSAEHLVTVTWHCLVVILLICSGQL